MELHQMIASVALKAIEATEQLRILERREHERHVDKLLDDGEAAVAEARKYKAAAERWEIEHNVLDEAHTKTMRALEDAQAEIARWEAEVQRVNGERERMATKIDDQDEIIEQLRAVANSIRIAEPDGDGDVWLHIDTPTQKASFNLGKDYELVSIAGSALRVFEQQRQAALKRVEG